MVHVVTSDLHSELCPIHRFADCNDTSLDTWICYALASCVVCAVDSLGFEPTTLGQHHRDQMGWQSAGYFPCIASFDNSLFLLGLGNPRDGSRCTVYGHLQDHS